MDSAVISQCSSYVNTVFNSTGSQTHCILFAAYGGGGEQNSISCNESVAHMGPKSALLYVWCILQLKVKCLQRTNAKNNLRSQRRCKERLKQLNYKSQIGRMFFALLSCCLSSTNPVELRT